MNISKSIVVVNSIISDFTEIFVQRLVFRLNRLHKPGFTIIIEDETKLSQKCLEILNTLNSPFMIVSDIKQTPFYSVIPNVLPLFNQSPYKYMLINRERKIEPDIFQLKMDRSLNLEDNHIHTQMAFCNGNMDAEKGIAIGRVSGIGKMRFTEHSSQMYIPFHNFTSRDYYVHGLSITDKADYRIDNYLNLKRTHESDFIEFGLELDFDFSGKPIIYEQDLKHFDYILGAMHMIPEITPEAFLKQLEMVVTHNIDVLAHPFRIFKRNGKELPVKLFKPVAKILKESNTAAEINFHTNEPPEDFFRECLDMGVKLSFGSDSHNLGELGDFFYHLDFLKSLGVTGDYDKILWRKK